MKHWMYIVHNTKLSVLSFIYCVFFFVVCIACTYCFSAFLYFSSPIASMQMKVKSFHNPLCSTLFDMQHFFFYFACIVHVLCTKYLGAHRSKWQFLIKMKGEKEEEEKNTRRPQYRMLRRYVCIAERMKKKKQNVRMHAFDLFDFTKLKFCQIGLPQFDISFDLNILPQRKMLFYNVKRQFFHFLTRWYNCNKTWIRKRLMFIRKHAHKNIRFFFKRKMWMMLTKCLLVFFFFFNKKSKQKSRIK